MVVAVVVVVVVVVVAVVVVAVAVAVVIVVVVDPYLLAIPRQTDKETMDKKKKKKKPPRTAIPVRSICRAQPSGACA